MNKKELKKAYMEGLISEESYKDQLFKIESTPTVRKKRSIPVSLSEEEFTLLLKHTKREEHRTAFLLGYAAGLRLSEIIGGIRSDGSMIPPLTKEKINFNEKSIHIEDAKGGKDRIVPLPKGFKESLLKHLPITQYYKNIPSGRRGLERAFKNAARNAGLLNTKPKLHFHSLRHGFGTRLAGQRVPIHHIRTMMGHSNISTTNVYLESNPKDALKSYQDFF